MSDMWKKYNILKFYQCLLSHPKVHENAHAISHVAAKQHQRNVFWLFVILDYCCQQKLNVETKSI